VGISEPGAYDTGPVRDVGFGVSCPFIGSSSVLDRVNYVPQRDEHGFGAKLQVSPQSIAILYYTLENSYI